MTMISRQQVEHIARLARIRLTEEEKEKFEKDLSKILEYFEKLSSLDLTEVEPMTHPLAQRNATRADEVEKEQREQADELLSAASLSEGRFIKVRAILNPNGD